jgi:DNA-directed RNA polymerase beta' subunit
MKIDLMDVERLIRTNGLEGKEVTNPILFEAGNVPTPDGMLSLEIFGMTSKERRENYAYISLHDYFIHPYVYKILLRLDRKIEAVVKGTRNFIITEDGQIVENENGSNGCAWLYKNWEKIKFKRNESNVRNERINLIEAYGKNVLFIKRWIVIPAFYRDVNFQNVDSGKVSHNELTDLYCKLLRFANMVAATSEFSFMTSANKGKVQDTLVEIYDYFKHKLEKKNGLIRKSLLGKTIDYGVRAVIAAPEFRQNRYDDNIVSFTHCAVPVSMICTLFFPFMLHELRNFFNEQYEMLGYKIEDLSEYNKKLSGTADLLDFNFYYGDDYFKKMMDNFTRTYDDRFKKIEIPLRQEQPHPIYYKIKLQREDGTEIVRDMTITDVLFIAANRAAADKHVFLTRYPITNHLGSFASKINISSTTQTEKLIYNGVLFKHYPKVDFSMSNVEISTYFYDVLKLSNVLLKQLGGDYDGDQMSIKGIFSQEANAECDKIVRSKANILDINASNVRKTENEAIQTLYTLTKRTSAGREEGDIWTDPTQYD